MKKVISGICAAALLATSVIGLTACKPAGETINKTKTQLYVFNFDGGYGTEWLKAAKARYEAYHAETSFEEGKTGVQVVTKAKKQTLENTKRSIKTGKEEVYFSEYAYYYALLQEEGGLLGDMTAAVTGDLSVYNGGDASGKTIEDKLTPQHKSYYGVTKDDGVHYYGIPHYAGYMGITYNVEMFDDRGTYFVDPASPDVSVDAEDDLSYFTMSWPDADKSAGPDGQKGTPDDGLPTTYDEFYRLCRVLKRGGKTPLIWGGASYKEYLSNLAVALATNNEGAANTMLTYSHTGTATGLAPVGSATATTVELNDTNAYEVFRQEGRKQALEFIYNIINADDGAWRDDDSFSTSQTIVEAQDAFVDPESNIAMLIDGIWWESEASETFEQYAALDSSAAKANRNFAWMPLPKATAEQAANHTTTLFDQLYSICFIKPGLSALKQEMACDFIKFVNTDQSLIEFTKVTNVPKALVYDMGSEINTLTKFGQSVMRIKQSADIVYPISASEKYKNHQGSFAPVDLFYSTIGDKRYDYPAERMYAHNTTAEELFNGSYEFWKSQWQKPTW